MLRTAQALRRYLHTTLPLSAHSRRRRRPVANPGAAYHLKEFKEHEPLQEDPEGFGDMETDFMHVHHTHKEHLEEERQQRERIKRLIIKKKYFDEPRLPNLLTYAEKEQIRLLHARDPEEWPIDRLAESFPATPAIIEKIVRAKWRPRTAKRIQEHDNAVIRNWEELHAGKCKSQLPQELLEHLRKFTMRRKEDLLAMQRDAPTPPELPKPATKEFLSIITSCKRYAEREESENTQKLLQQEQQQQRPALSEKEKEEETYLLEQVQDKRNMRLQDLQNLKLINSNKWANTDLKPSQAMERTIEQRAVETFGNRSGTGILPAVSSQGESHQLSYNYADKFESGEIVITAEDQRLYDITKVKDRVYIPKKLRKDGATYKVEDCYYDDDGEFLYRVPGMTGGR